LPPRLQQLLELSYRRQSFDGVMLLSYQSSERELSNQCR